MRAANWRKMMNTTTIAKPAFRAWLDAEKLTVPAFVDKSLKKGVRLRQSTVYKWARGAQPRPTKREDLEEAFKTIKF
jgi:hypothetical protein